MCSLVFSGKFPLCWKLTEVCSPVLHLFLCVSFHWLWSLVLHQQKANLRRNTVLCQLGDLKWLSAQWGEVRDNPRNWAAPPQPAMSFKDRGSWWHFLLNLYWLSFRILCFYCPLTCWGIADHTLISLWRRDWKKFNGQRVRKSLILSCEVPGGESFLWKKYKNIKSEVKCKVSVGKKCAENSRKR